MDRRNFLKGILAASIAPALIPYANLMKLGYKKTGMLYVLQEGDVVEWNHSVIVEPPPNTVQIKIQGVLEEDRIFLYKFDPDGEHVLIDDATAKQDGEVTFNHEVVYNTNKDIFVRLRRTTEGYNTVAKIKPFKGGG